MGGRGRKVLKLVGRDPRGHRVSIEGGISDTNPGYSIGSYRTTSGMISQLSQREVEMTNPGEINDIESNTGSNGHKMWIKAFSSSSD